MKISLFTQNGKINSSSRLQKIKGMMSFYGTNLDITDFPLVIRIEDHRDKAIYDFAVKKSDQKEKTYQLNECPYQLWVYPMQPRPPHNFNFAIIRLSKKTIIEKNTKEKLEIKGAEKRKREDYFIARLIKENTWIEEILFKMPQDKPVTDEEIVEDCWRWAQKDISANQDLAMNTLRHHLHLMVTQKFDIPKVFVEQKANSNEFNTRIGRSYAALHRYEYTHHPDAIEHVFISGKTILSSLKRHVRVRFNYSTLPIMSIRDEKYYPLFTSLEFAGERGDIVQWAFPPSHLFDLYISGGSLTPHYLIESRRFKYFCTDQDNYNLPQHQRAIAIWCEAASQVEAHLGGKAWRPLIIPKNNMEIRAVCENL